MKPERPWTRQIFFAASLGVLIGSLTYVELMRSPEHGLKDFTWLYRGIHELLAGRNPYQDPSLGRHHPYPADAPLFYPLPTLLAVLPLAWLPPLVAASVFSAIVTTVFILGVRSRLGVSGVLLFFSPAMLQGRLLLQLTPLFVGTALLWPRATALALLKPNVGVALLAYRPGVRGPLVMAGIFAVSLMFLPTWPLDWYRNVRQQVHAIPALVLPFGPLVGLAWLARHLPEGRLLLALSLVPQRFIFYDQLPLLLAARTGWQRVVLVGASWMAYAGWSWRTGGELSNYQVDDLIIPWVMGGCYVPALALVLYHRFGPFRTPAWARLRQGHHEDRRPVSGSLTSTVED